MDRKKQIVVTVLSVALALGVGALSAALFGSGAPLYEELIQPAWAPPAWVFPVVWTILYVLMGVAAARVFLTGEEGRRYALGLYLVQLAVNFFWSFFFFQEQAFLAAFFWLLLLLLLVLETFWAFAELDKKAARLLLPYLAWLVIAAFLNLSVYLLNR